MKTRVELPCFSCGIRCCNIRASNPQFGAFFKRHKITAMLKKRGKEIVEKERAEERETKCVKMKRNK